MRPAEKRSPRRMIATERVKCEQIEDYGQRRGQEERLCPRSWSKRIWCKIRSPYGHAETALYEEKPFFLHLCVFSCSPGFCFEFWFFFLVPCHCFANGVVKLINLTWYYSCCIPSIQFIKICKSASWSLWFIREHALFRWCVSRNSSLLPPFVLEVRFPNLWNKISWKLGGIGEQEVMSICPLPLC